MLNSLTSIKDFLLWFCALAGTGMFIIQFLLNFFSLDGDETNDDSGTFTWLSKHTITVFLMMFGWTGLTCIKQFELPATATALISLAAGSISIFITGFIFKMARKMRSPGTVFRIEDAIGKEATIYQRIPKDGIGKISVSIHQLTHEIDAVSSHHEELASFTSVQIIKKADEKTVVVVPIK
ncbi:MAG TPA: hypothetical protein VLG49_04495 [Rhabdochlamydiaceae bacterium]|nr:hypothetical protein [Rhabdochlamydiaceae bacterium]